MKHFMQIFVRIRVATRCCEKQCKTNKNYNAIQFCGFKERESRLGAVHKDVRSQGEGVCRVRTFFGQGGKGSSDADVHTFLWKKLRNFLNLWCVHTDKGDWANADILRTWVRGLIFREFVRMSFMNGSLEQL